MNSFYKTTCGAIRCDFTIDESDARFTGLPDMLPEDIAASVAEFAPSALPDRTYDAEAVVGSFMHTAGEDRKTITKTLLLVCSLPDSPIVAAPGSTPGKERFQLRPSLVKECEWDFRF